MPGKKRYVAFGVMAVLAVAQSAQASIVETFDTGLNGWAMLKNNGTLTWQGSGGDPGGYALYDDTKAGVGTIKAPSAFLGDLSQYNEGVFAFDFNVFTLGAGIRQYRPITVTLYNGKTHVQHIVGVPAPSWPGLGWQSFSIPMSASEWGISSGKWDALLAHVTQINISLESTVNVRRPYDSDGIDNISLTGLGEPPTPEPATLGVILAGALPLLMRRRRHSVAR